LALDTRHNNCPGIEQSNVCPPEVAFIGLEKVSKIFFPWRGKEMKFGFSYLLTFQSCSSNSFAKKSFLTILSKLG